MRRIVVVVSVALCCGLLYAGWELYSSGNEAGQIQADGSAESPDFKTRRVGIKRLDVKLEPIYETRDGGSIDILLTVGADTVLSEVNLWVQGKDNLLIVGPLHWVDTLDIRNPETYTIPVTVPKGENSTMLVYVYSQVPFRSGGDKIFFNYTGDTLLAYDFFSAPKPKPRTYSSDDPSRDTLTEEQLRREYHVWLDLRDSSQRRSAERILGSLPDSSEVAGDRGYYILWLTLDEILRLGEQGIELDEVKGEWSPAANDSVYTPRPDTSTIEGYNLGPNSPSGSVCREHLKTLIRVCHYI